MRVFRRLSGIVLIVLLATGAGCQSMMVGPPSGPKLSPQTLQVSPRVVLAGALGEDAVLALKAANAVVIDLRHPAEGATDEARRMAVNGIPWINLPQGRETPTLAEVQYLDEILDAWPGRNVVLHCATGNRAGKLWATWRVQQGATLESARSEVSPIVTMPAVKAAIAEPTKAQ